MKLRSRTSIGALALPILLLGTAAVPAAAAVTPATPSDFDGDGFVDLAIGAPGEAIGNLDDAGLVNIIYGGDNGLTAAGDQTWSQDSDGVLGGSEGRPNADAGDLFGTTVASGDFDRDGHADLAIGVPLDRVGGTAHAGAVNVLYGDAAGLTATRDQLWTQDALPDDPETGDGFGQSLAAADFDGDGFWDLAIGAPGEGLGDDQSPGSVTVVYGGPEGLDVADATTLTRAMTGAPYLEDSPHGFGYALAAGHFDAGGTADLAVGVPTSGIGGDDPVRPLVDGEVDIFYSGGDGLTADGAHAWTQDTTDVPGDAEEGDWFGSALAAGDMDADGRDDLAIGVRFDRVDGLRSGAVNVLYGTADGLAAADSQLWHQGVAGVPGVIEVGDDFGRAVAIGDLDGDGFADLAVGVPGEAIGSGFPGAGVVNVIYGSASGLDGAGAQDWSQASSGVPGSPEATDIRWDSFGATLTIGDYGRSNADDLTIGVPLEAIGSTPDAGMVNVLYGRSSGLSGSGAQGWSQDSDGIKGAAESQDYLSNGLP